MQYNEAKLATVLKKADELKAKKAALEKKLRDEIARCRVEIAKVQSRADSVDKEFEAHGLCCLAGLLIKIDPSYTKKLLTEAQTNPETPAGHAGAIKYALQNRGVL